MMSSILSDTYRLLTFRKPTTAIAQQWPYYLAFGLCFTWLAGLGRYWDNPRALWWQTWGLGSLAYVLCLAAVLWVIIAPLRPNNWSYRNVLVFITLTSPPALLYAIPVEMWMSIEAASTTNAWFLVIVATWRVALLVWFLRRVAGLKGGAILVATLLPLALIVASLTVLNLEHVIFNLMAGLKPDQVSSNDTAYGVITLMGILSVLASPVLLLLYVVQIYGRWAEARQLK
jgi:hypothetical protein